MTELDKLEKYLADNGYHYTRHDEDGKYQKKYDMYIPLTIDRHQIYIYEDGKLMCSAICQRGSYGYDEGLIEILSEKLVRIKDDVEGWLTADEIIKRLEETYGDMDEGEQ